MFRVRTTSLARFVTFLKLVYRSKIGGMDPVAIQFE